MGFSLKKFAKGGFGVGAAAKVIGKGLGLTGGIKQVGMSKNQKALEQMLMQRAQGKGTSVAELQLKQAQADAQKKLMGAIASQRARNVGLARREALQAGAEQMADIGNQGAILRGQEQQNAQNQLLGMYTGQQQMNQQTQIAQSQQKQQGFSNLVNAGATVGMLALSDKNAKTNLKKDDKSIQKFLDSLKGMSYNYKEGIGENPNKKNIGVVAQNLEKTKEGDAMVEETPSGYKQIDFGKGFNAMLASMSHINEKQKDMEKFVKTLMDKKKKRGA